eukprot:scaffold8850_cov134-Isochrysis_galbana.AAC.1
MSLPPTFAHGTPSKRVASSVGGSLSQLVRLGASPAPRPKELVVRIELPGVASAADVDLDITPRRLSLREEATGFELDLELPHAIDETHGSAKFDRSKQALTVVLPVVASDAAPAVFKPATEGQAAAEAAAEQADAEAAEAKNRAREAE